MKVSIPYPPSANNFYAVFRGRKVISRKGRAWINRCLALPDLFDLEAMTGPVAVTLNTYRPRRAGDIDSPIKHSLDILQKAHVIKNDNQITRLVVERGDDKLNPRVEIEVVPR